MRAGNYTPLGKATHLQDCIGRACDLNEGHLALMLGQYCYSVMCHNQRICQTIPAKPTHLRPKVAYLAWTQEPIEQDTSMNSFSSGYYFLKSGIYNFISLRIFDRFQGGFQMSISNMFINIYSIYAPGLVRRTYDEALQKH